MTGKHPRFDWEKRICSAAGPANPTTRHVLLTIATHADKVGQAFPSMRILAEETGLSERAIVTHVQIAVGEGWLRCFAAQGQRQGWKRNVYVLTIPERTERGSSPSGGEALNDVQHLPAESASVTRAVTEGTERGAQGTERRSEGTEPDDIKALNVVHTNNVLNNSLNKTGNSTRADATPFSDDREQTTPRPGGIAQWAQENGIAKAEDESQEAFSRRRVAAWMQSLNDGGTR